MEHPQDVLSRWFFLRIVKYDFEGQILKLMILQTIQSSPSTIIATSLVYNSFKKLDQQVICALSFSAIAKCITQLTFQSCE